MDANRVASVFEFSEPQHKNACTPLVQPTVIDSSLPVGSRGHDSNQTLIPTMAVLFVDWLSTDIQQRTYRYRDRKNVVPIYVITGKHMTRK